MIHVLKEIRAYVAWAVFLAVWNTWPLAPIAVGFVMGYFIGVIGGN